MLVTGLARESGRRKSTCWIVSTMLMPVTHVYRHAHARE
ncbi:MAG: hypothetical protein AVDCRST_MAG68-3673 [uncultured Gemmatimonadetes bacterium]|uniref:Uncharacterized protein n=1 Tax=uncultured Gemmatimonadota bacterium TaxID=203437 RepID=A0A6J4M995_9BACT|nr:MAG: hypothetical protein AVDCRST_MAG68-3673 [uncultured Gemmatimonadota bacterium]